MKNRQKRYFQFKTAIFNQLRERIKVFQNSFVLIQVSFKFRDPKIYTFQACPIKSNPVCLGVELRKIWLFKLFRPEVRGYYPPPLRG